MGSTNMMARTLHDVGLAAWFGGSLMGSVSLDHPSETIAYSDRTRSFAHGWERWRIPRNAAVGSFLVGSALMTWGNRERLRSQSGVAAAAGVKTVVTALAVALEAYADRIGRRIAAGAPPTASATQPTSETPERIADLQRRLGVVDTAIPAATGALVALAAVMGEQQRPTAVAEGVAHKKIRRVASRLTS